MMLRNWERIPENAKIKQVTIKLENKNEWYVFVQCDLANKIEDPIEQHINKQLDKRLECGIDVGLTNLVKDSNDNVYGNLSTLKEMEQYHRKLLRKRDHHKLFSSRWKKLNIKAAKYYTKISRAKKLQLDELSKILVDKYSMIGIEKLNIKDMLERNPYDKKRSIRRNISLASWGKLFKR